MSDWGYAQRKPQEELALLHFFSFKKLEPGREIEFRITVKEFAERNQQGMLFFAQADQQTNQKTAPFTPSGWGESLGQALRECILNIDRFPFEG